MSTRQFQVETADPETGDATTETMTWPAVLTALRAMPVGGAAVINRVEDTSGPLDALL